MALTSDRGDPGGRTTNQRLVNGPVINYREAGVGGGGGRGGGAEIMKFRAVNMFFLPGISSGRYFL